MHNITSGPVAGRLVLRAQSGSQRRPANAPARLTPAGWVSTAYPVTLSKNITQ